MKISNNKLQNFKIVYSEKFNHKFYDSEWVFYEKNICKISIKAISNKTYIGTWSVKNDTITANFFYGNRFSEERKLSIDKTNNNKLTELLVKE